MILPVYRLLEAEPHCSDLKVTLKQFVWFCWLCDSQSFNPENVSGLAINTMQYRDEESLGHARASNSWRTRYLRAPL